jgi:EAL domain-containing protein (putative c-di-GMP-specific phosphodiesterase class I)
VISSLDDACLPGEALIIEVTEASLATATSPEMLRDQLQAISGHGVRVAIEDFGMGSLPLFNLAKLPIDMFKIDTQFIQSLGGIHETTQNWAFTGAILHLIDSMRVTAVAEGIERAEQVETLRTLRCPLAQGDFFGSPASAAVMGQTLAATRI